MNILDEIAVRTKERIDEKKKTLSMEAIIEMTALLGCPPEPSSGGSSGTSLGALPGRETGEPDDSSQGFPFEEALRGEDISFICEIKKASPSKGIIAGDFPYLKIAEEYESAGAAAISVLTEPFYFKGDDLYLREIARHVSIPLLRKDFTVDSYMIYEAKLLGASAVLLICAILDHDTLKEYIKIAHQLGLSALIEAHNEKEVEDAIHAGARIIGVNNRDLKTFHVDVTISERLRKLVPKDKIFISESGIKTSEDIGRLRKNGVNAVLIGETLMRSTDKRAELIRLRGEKCCTEK